MIRRALELRLIHGVMRVYRRRHARAQRGTVRVFILRAVPRKDMK